MIIEKDSDDWKRLWWLIKTVMIEKDSHKRERFSQMIANKKRFKKILIKEKNFHRWSQIKISEYKQLSIGRLRERYISSIINEGPMVILDLLLLFLFYKKISDIQKVQKAYKRTKTKKTAFWCE